MSLRYLHTMVRVTDIEKSLDFYCNKLGMEGGPSRGEQAGRYTLVFLAAPATTSARRRRARTAAGAHLSTGIRKTMAKAAISGIWRSRSTTSTPPATG